MKKFLKTKGAVISAICLFVVLIAGFSAILSPGEAGFVQNGLQTLFRPAESGIRHVVRTLERMYDYMFHFDTLEANHNALLDRVAEYEHLARHAEEVQEENERLRTLLSLQDPTRPMRHIDAAILSWDASNWTSAFTIDRGADLGIEVGDAVQTERGELIGIVREVGRSWATVHTILDPGVHVGAQLGSGVSAVAEGNFALMHASALRLSYVPSGEVPLLNDIITTSGLGGMIPAGLIIGRVDRVVLEDTGASFFAEIEPAVDFNRLVQVFVVQLLHTEEG